MKPTLVPNTLASTAAAAPLNVLWPETYSGNGGVMRSETQAGSATVASLPSVSAWRMAVIGLQNSDEYLASQSMIAASASTTLSCALSATLLPCWRAAVSRRFNDHRRWMLRRFVLLCSAVMLRVFGGLGTVLEVKSLWFDPVVSWVSWLLPLVTFELLNARKSGSRRGAAASATQP